MDIYSHGGRDSKQMPTRQLTKTIRRTFTQLGKLCNLVGIVRRDDGKAGRKQRR